MSSTGELLLQLREELKRESLGRQRQEEVNSKLQDEYDVLLKRLAEAELHIDRLRLGAHVEVHRRVVTTYDTEQRARLGQTLGAQLDPSSKQPDPENPYRSHGNKSTVVESAEVDADLVENGWSEPPASNESSPANSPRNTSAVSQASLTSSATTADISLMSAPSIAHRASAESMQVARLFRIRGLREQLSSLSDRITADGASVGEVMAALGAIQEEHRQLAEEIAGSAGGRGGGARSREAIGSELASLAEQLRELEELLQSQAQYLPHSPSPTLPSSAQVLPSVSATESAMGTSGRVEAADGSATEDDSLSEHSSSLEFHLHDNHFTESMQDARVQTPPLTPPSAPPPHLHSGTLTDREDRGDNDHTHTSHTHSQISGSHESLLSTQISTPEYESDTHALREGGAHGGRGRTLSPGAGLELPDEGTLSDLSHSYSFPSDRPRLVDTALTRCQQLESESVDQPGHSFDGHDVPTSRVPLPSTPPPSSLYNRTNGGGYQSGIPRRLLGHTPSRPRPSHTHSAQEHRKSSSPNSSWQSPTAPYPNQRPPSDWTVPGEVDSGFADSDRHSRMMGGFRPPTDTSVYQSEHRRDGDREPSLTAAAIDALRAELTDLKQQILNTSQQPDDSVPSSPSVPSPRTHSPDLEVPIPPPPTSLYSAQLHADGHTRPNVTLRSAARSQTDKPRARRSVSSQASPASRSKASQSRPSMSSTATQTRGDRALPPQPTTSPLVHTQSHHNHLWYSHPSTPVRQATLLSSPLATPLHTASYPTTPAQQTPLHSVQFSSPYLPSSTDLHAAPHHHHAATPSRTLTVDHSYEHESTPRPEHTHHSPRSGTGAPYANTPTVILAQTGWLCSRCGTHSSNRDDTATAAPVHDERPSNGEAAAAGFPAHGDGGPSSHRHRRQHTGRRSIGAQTAAGYYPPHRAGERRRSWIPSEEAAGAATRRSDSGPPPKYGGPCRHVHTSMQCSGTESSGSGSELRRDPDAKQQPRHRRQLRHSSGSEEDGLRDRGLRAGPRKRGSAHYPVHPVTTSTPKQLHRHTGHETEEKRRPARAVPQPTNGHRREPGLEAVAISAKTRREEKSGRAYAYTRAESPLHSYVHRSCQEGYDSATSSSEECLEEEAVYPAEAPREYFILKRAKPRKKSHHYAYVHEPTFRGKTLSYLRVSSPRTEDVYFSDPALSPRRRGVVTGPRSTEEMSPEDRWAWDDISSKVEVTPDLGEVCLLARQLSQRSNRMRGRLDSEISRHSSGLY